MRYRSAKMASLLRAGRALRCTGALRRSAWVASPAANAARSFSSSLRSTSVQGVRTRFPVRTNTTEAAKPEVLGVAYNELTLGVPKERDGETRVAVTPASVQVGRNFLL